MSAPTIDAAAVREDGPSVIRFESRAEFHAARDSHIVTIINPFDIFVRGAEVRVPVLFGDGNTLWRTVAVYPTQKPCDCDAEVVHQLGCSAREYPDVSMFAEPAPVDPIDWATVAECADCGGLNGAHQEACWRASRVCRHCKKRITRCGHTHSSDGVAQWAHADNGKHACFWLVESDGLTTWAEPEVEPSRVDPDAAARIPVATLDLPRRIPGAALVDNPVAGSEVAL